MAMTTAEPRDDLLARASSHFREHWGWYLAEGLVLIVLGLAAIVLPPLATLAVTLVLGWLFLLSGILGLVATIRLREAPGFWWSLVSALLALVVGVLLLWNPFSGAVSLTLLLTAFFLVDGIASIMYALRHRHDASGRWGFILASGVITLLLAVVIMIGLPGTAAYALGLLVGIDMVFSGSMLVALAVMAHSRPRPGALASSR
jgi:uncharacterized membrane protein HdeD (DUF308 family)